MPPDPVAARHTAPGPKRMLSLDGGGVRGILSLGFLRRLEELLRRRYGADDFVLSEYFDLIGGTSTGAIIAAFLARGGAVDDLVELYRRLARGIFRKRFWRRGLLFTKFEEGALNRVLKAELGDITFSDPSIRTGLMVMTKRWDTESSWVLHNLRGSSYYEKYTHGYSVRQVVRASTAAPSYFRPERFEVKPGVSAAFVDGGVTPHNNPALQMLMLAALEGFGLNWRLGPESLALVSVGTGRHVRSRNPTGWQSRLAALNGLTSLQMLMADASDLNETLLQWLSRSPTAREIDKEIGDLRNDSFADAPQLHYVRYDAVLNPSWLRELGVMISDEEAASLAEMDDAGNVELLKTIGEKAGEAQVTAEHLPACFDVRERR